MTSMWKAPCFQAPRDSQRSQSATVSPTVLATRNDRQNERKLAGLMAAAAVEAALRCRA